MSERDAFYTVDRIEGDVAVLVGDDGVGVDVRRSALGVRVRQGIVLRVPLSAHRPDWSSCTIDDVEGERRLAEARARLARLRNTDPGGDVVL
ncbi:MAG TPA: DUF3006 family protein [Gemmatimonadales bacterium]|jgi:hypothetical protein